MKTIYEERFEIKRNMIQKIERTERNIDTLGSYSIRIYYYYR